MYLLILFLLFKHPSPEFTKFKTENACCCCLGREGKVERHNPVQLNSTSPPFLPLHPLKNALCKIHVFYVLTCCFCLQQDPFSFWILLGKAPKEIKEMAIGEDIQQAWSPSVYMCAHLLLSNLCCLQWCCESDMIYLCMLEARMRF